MKHFFLFVSLFFLSQVALGQEKSVENTRPKVGLVLSGGGAKGFAHIGVIKVLESHGIKAKIVTGTSAGSFVG